MRNNPYDPARWKTLIPDLSEVLVQMERTPIISIGITPYTRIIPAFFLKNFSVYATKRSSDVDILEEYFPMHVLEDHQPDLAKRVHGTGYLIGSYAFQAFIKSRRTPVRLMLNTVTKKATEDLEKMKTSWLGNVPESFETVAYKGSFRKLVKSLGLPSLASHVYSRQEFFVSSFESLFKELEGSFVVQRADKEVGGNEGTFFIHAKVDFEECISALSVDEGFENVIVTPYIDGYSTSMLGCVLEQGTLSGPLQLQLIDVQQSLHGVKGNGIFFGNDLGFHPWGEQIEKQAEEVVEKVGDYMRAQGYRGIFGIDFLYDKKRNVIFPNECNPRAPGSAMLYSLALLKAGLPPLDFFHIMAQLGIKSSFDFKKTNAALKIHASYSHIAFSPRGITSMELPLKAGIYAYDNNVSLSYRGPGISLADLKNEQEFLLIDTVPSLGSAIEQNVPRLFKFIFPRSIANSTYEIDSEAGFLVDRFAKSLLHAAKVKQP